ncbi:reverse transcriptase domain-containing protein [Tanacetum coccineum]
MRAKNIIKEVHEGSYGMHSGLRSVVSKITRLGYYWPSMHKDAKELIHKCKACQIYSSVRRKPKQEMTSIMSSWPFSQWGIDIVGPLPTALGGARFLVVEVTNREIIKGMVQRLGKAHQAWINELPLVLWAHRIMPKSSNGKTPFSLVYGSKAVIPIEISMETKRVQDFDPKENKKRRLEDLDILDERREMASIKEAHYK